MSFSEIAKRFHDVVNAQLFPIQGKPITLVDLLIFGIFIFVALLVSRLLRRSANAAMDRRRIDDPGTRAITQRLIHWAVIFVGFTLAIQNLGIDLSTILAAGAVFGVGIGFAFQNVAQNFISGIILLFERSIKPGDVLEVDGEVVRVEHMRIRSTVGRTRDDEQLIIPNAQLAQGTVKNYTMEDSHYRVTVGVGVAYESDMKETRAVLEKTTESIEWMSAVKKPRVFMTEFGDSSVNFQVAVWTNDPWNARRAASDLHEAIWHALADAGITIAFPQVDVHFDPVVDDTLTDLKKAS